MRQATTRCFVIAVAILGALAVAAGAFGAHELTDEVSPRLLETWQTAVRYQMWHALAILFVALSRPSRLAPGVSVAVCVAWLLGIVVFSGSLYALVLSGITQLGAVTPLGGMALIVGWILLAVAAIRQPGE